VPYQKYIKKYGKGFALALLFLMLEAATDLMLPTLLAIMIDRGVMQRDLDLVIRIGGLMVVIALTSAIFASFRNIIAVKVSHYFGAELRADLFSKIQQLSIAQLGQLDRSSLMTLMTNDITVVQNFVSGMMRIFVKAPMIGVGALILAIRLNLQLSIVFAVVIPIVALLIIWNMKRGFTRFMKVQQSLDAVNRAVREYLSGVRVVKAFHRDREEEAKFQTTNEGLRAASTSAMRSLAIFSPAMMVVVNLGIVSILWAGGMLLAGSGPGNQEQILGELVAFIQYMTLILFSLIMISIVFTMFVRAKASVLRIGDIFKLQATAQDYAPEREEQGVESGSITFERVNFAYSSSEPVLHDVTLHCPGGTMLGIIGSTGSGKSTIVSLIPRFYEANAGVVKVDGCDVLQLNPAKLRESIAIVPQKSLLFSGTIAENIRWGKADATLAEVQAAAQCAAAHTFISELPEGYESRLGQRGVNLSGGQKQRIAIARALIRQPRILILDDCMSAIDPTTEMQIRQSLRTFIRGSTCIIISQRITSLIDADRILVLDRGHVVGLGTHETLLNECPVYQEIWQSQRGTGTEGLPNVNS
jgi:ATP-binding cassette subfamily B multidrug efflux pump